MRRPSATGAIQRWQCTSGVYCSIPSGVLVALGWAFLPTRADEPTPDVLYLENLDLSRMDQEWGTAAAMPLGRR